MSRTLVIGATATAALSAYYLNDKRKHEPNSWSAKAYNGLRDDGRALLSALTFTRTSPDQPFEKPMAYQVKDRTKEEFGKVSRKYNDLLEKADDVKEGATTKNLTHALETMQETGSNKRNADKMAADSIYGWGEIARDVAGEKLKQEEEKEKQASSRFGSGGWFTSGSGSKSTGKLLSGKGKQASETAVDRVKEWSDSTSNASRESYEELKSKLEQQRDTAKENMDAAWEKVKSANEDAAKTAKKHWWSFKNEKLDPTVDKVQDSVSRNYEAAKDEYNRAVDALARSVKKD